MRIFLFLYLSLFLFQVQATASVFVSPSILSIASDRKADIYVKNTSNNKAYFHVDIARLEKPGTPDEKKFSSKNPRELGLLATPSKFIIPAGKSRVIRLTALTPPKKSETPYLVTIRPAVGPMIFQPKNKGGSNEDETNAAVTIVLAYAIRVTTLPINPSPKITLNRSGKGITAKNTGNVNALLTVAKQCDRTDRKCQSIKGLGKRLYPGNTWTAQLPKAAPVSFLMDPPGLKKQVITSN